MVHAIVLIEAEPKALSTLGGALADVDGVAEVVRNRVAQLPGIRRTHTMLAFEAFSRHDLEALFSIGN